MWNFNFVIGRPLGRSFYLYKIIKIPLPCRRFLVSLAGASSFEHRFYIIRCLSYLSPNFSWSSFAIIFQPNTSRFHPPFPYVRIRYICLIKDLSVVQDPFVLVTFLICRCNASTAFVVYMMRRICSLNPMKFVSSVQSFPMLLIYLDI